MGRSKAGHAVTNLLLLLLIAGLYLGTTQPQTISVSAPVYRGQAEGKIALQFAVSWDAGALEDILDTLEENHARVTFALSGEWAARNPALARRMAQDGHELATMGYAVGQDGRLSWVQEDVERSLEAIEAAAGVKPTLYYSGGRSVTVSGRAASCCYSPPRPLGRPLAGFLQHYGRKDWSLSLWGRCSNRDRIS